jgi:hypothetical protein
MICDFGFRSSSQEGSMTPKGIAEIIREMREILAWHDVANAFPKMRVIPRDKLQRWADHLEAVQTPQEEKDMSDQATLTTMTGKFSSLEEWNALQDELTLWRGRTLRALQHLSNLTGRFKDLNELQAVLDDDERRWALLSEMGLTMHVTEAEKDWMVPLAHAEHKSLGNWVRDVFREAAERKRSESGSAVQTPPTEKA